MNISITNEVREILASYLLTYLLRRTSATAPFPSSTRIDQLDSELRAYLKATRTSAGMIRGSGISYTTPCPVSVVQNTNRQPNTFP